MSLPIEYYNKLSPIPYAHLHLIYKPLDIFSIINECFFIFENPNYYGVRDIQFYPNQFYFRIKKILKMKPKIIEDSIGENDRICKLIYEENVVTHLREIVTLFIQFIFSICYQIYEDMFYGDKTFEMMKIYYRYLQQIMSLNLFPLHIREMILPILDTLITITTQ